MITDVNVHGFELEPNHIRGGTEYSKQATGIRLVFDDSWDLFPTRKITFHPPRCKPIIVIIPENGEIIFPEEVTRRCSAVGFSISGYSSSTPMMVSAPGVIEVSKTYDPDGISADAPTQTEIQQVLEYMQTAVDAANEVVERANNGEFNGKDTVLRPATTSTLGGIIVGDNLDVTETGTLSALTDEDDFPELTNLEIEQIISNLGGF